MTDNVEPLKLPLHPIIRTRLITLMGENETLQYEIEKLRAALREIRNKARTGKPPFMSSKTDFFQIASKALGEKE